MPLLQRSLDPGTGCVAFSWWVRVPPQRLWWALTDREALPHWLGQLQRGVFDAGDVVVIEHAENYACISSIEESVPLNALAMTWKFPDEAPSRLRLTLRPELSGTVLTLVHTELAESAASYLPGWHTHLLYLEALVEGRPRCMEDFWSTYESLS